MSFYQPPIDFDLDCFGPDVRFTKTRASYAMSTPDMGFVRGHSKTSRTRNQFEFTISPLLPQEVDHLRHIWRQTGGGCRLVLMRTPGNQKPIHAILGPLSLTQQTKGVWAASLQFTEAL